MVYKGKEVFIQWLEEAGLDAEVILQVLYDSIELGFIDWGTHKDSIIKLLENPTQADLFRIISNAETILKPLEAWMNIEMNLNTFREGTVSKYEYYQSVYKCSQIFNFILLCKPNP